MVTLFKDKTSIQRRSIAKPYLGRWLKVEGLISDIDARDNGEGCSLSLHWTAPDNNLAPSIHLRFDEEWKQTVLSLNTDMSVMCIGRIASIDHWWLQLEYCELVGKTVN
jgi:hypothetical protein